MATKLGVVLTYLEGLLPIKLLDAFFVHIVLQDDVKN